MTEQDKQLLLVDLCARLPYGVIGLYTWKNKRSYDKELTGNLYDELESSWNSIAEDSQFLPYLRPMSSMTEKEKKEYEFTFDSVYDTNDEGEDDDSWHKEWSLESFDWLNAHHFDFRNLIERGLAISTEEFNPYES